MPRRIVTFTTDFGLKDAYVAEMKGAFLAELDRLGCADPVQLVDVTHELPRHAVEQAAALMPPLLSSYPAGTVHVAVVDPGVGSSRRPIVVRAGGRFFVGPDNGIFTRVLDPGAAVFAIDSSRRRPSGSSVFDGRDLFAPVAACLLAGTDPAALGAPCSDPIRLEVPRPVRTDHAIRGRIMSIDHFGNMRTNIVVRDIPFGACVSVGSRSRLPINISYSDVASESVTGVISSDGSLEIAAREASAAAILGSKIGDEIVVEW